MPRVTVDDDGNGTGLGDAEGAGEGEGDREWAGLEADGTVPQAAIPSATAAATMMCRNASGWRTEHLRAGLGLLPPSGCLRSALAGRAEGRVEHAGAPYFQREHSWRATDQALNVAQLALFAAWRR